MTQSLTHACEQQHANTLYYRLWLGGLSKSVQLCKIIFSDSVQTLSHTPSQQHNETHLPRCLPVTHC